MTKPNPLMPSWLPLIAVVAIVAGACASTTCESLKRQLLTHSQQASNARDMEAAASGVLALLQGKGAGATALTCTDSAQQARSLLRNIPSNDTSSICPMLRGWKVRAWLFGSSAGRCHIPQLVHFPCVQSRPVR